MAIKHIDLVVGKAAILEGQKILISHYSVDGDMMTLFTDKGEKSYPMSKLDFVLSSIELISKSSQNQIAVKSNSASDQHHTMYSTTDYSIFKNIRSNRNVNGSHVKKLANAIQDKNLLHLNAIIVNKNFEVIDGQHRLEAAKYIGVPIYYIIDNEIGKSDIATLNTNKKNWSLDDYVNFYKNEGHEGFKILHDFMITYPGLPLSSALVLLSAGGVRDGNAIKQGYVDTNNHLNAHSLAELLIWLKDFFEPAMNTMVVQSIRDIASIEGFEIQVFKQKINDQPRSVVKCISRKQYLEMFLEIYNYKLSKNRLSIK